MLNESIPTVSATIASWTVFRITWSPLIGSPAASTVTGRNVSSPNSSVFITCFLPSGVAFVRLGPQGHAALSSYLSAQTSRFGALFLGLGERAAELRAG